jgi:Protein of unknown function (DUF2829)
MSEHKDTYGETTPLTQREAQTFGWALKQLWQGKKVFRHAWNGKGLYINLQLPDRNSKMSQPYMYIRTVDNQLVPWTVTQSDALESDWEIFK